MSVINHQLFVEQLAEKKLKTPHYWHFAREFSGAVVHSPYKRLVKRKAFPCHNVITNLREFCSVITYDTRDKRHYSDVIMSSMAFQITSVSIACSTICLGADQRKHQSSALLAFVRGIHGWPVDSPNKGPVTRKMLPFDDVLMKCYWTLGDFDAIKTTFMLWYGQDHWCYLWYRSSL